MTAVAGCRTCGGYGMHHDPVAHNWAPEWITCPRCKGEQTVRDVHDLDVTCPECDGDGGWEP